MVPAIDNVPAVAFVPTVEGFVWRHRCMLLASVIFLLSDYPESHLCFCCWCVPDVVCVTAVPAGSLVLLAFLLAPVSLLLLDKPSPLLQVSLLLLVSPLLLVDLLLMSILLLATASVLTWLVTLLLKVPWCCCWPFRCQCSCCCWRRYVTCIFCRFCRCLCPWCCLCSDIAVVLVLVLPLPFNSAFLHGSLPTATVCLKLSDFYNFLNGLPDKGFPGFSTNRD